MWVILIRVEEERFYRRSVCPRPSFVCRRYLYLCYKKWVEIKWSSSALRGASGRRRPLIGASESQDTMILAGNWLCVAAAVVAVARTETKQVQICRNINSWTIHWKRITFVLRMLYSWSTIIIIMCVLKCRHGKSYSYSKPQKWFWVEFLLPVLLMSNSDIGYPCHCAIVAHIRQTYRNFAINDCGLIIYIDGFSSFIDYF